MGFNFWFKQQLVFLQQHGMQARIKSLGLRLIKPIFQRIIASINARPRIRYMSIMIAHRVGLYSWARSFSSRLSGRIVHRKRPTLEMQHLTPRARTLYSNLKVAINKKRDSL